MSVMAISRLYAARRWCNTVCEKALRRLPFRNGAGSMIKVFGSPFSPFVRKVYLVAAFKGVEFEAEAANPRDPSAEFAACSPFRKMPAIQDEDYTLADSTAIAAYLDAKYPEPALFPKDPRALGRAVWWEEFADTIVMPSSGKVVFNRF